MVIRSRGRIVSRRKRPTRSCYSLLFSRSSSRRTASSSSTAATCRNNDGSITINAGGGTPGYEYSIDGGTNYQPANALIDIPSGPYNNIIVRDANGCTINLSETVPLLDTMRLELGPDSTPSSNREEESEEHTQ